VLPARQVVSALGAAVRNENVRRVELAWGASIAAEWAYFVALGVFAYQQGGASAVGIAGLVRLLPAAVVAPFAASLGDRFRRERFLLALMLLGSAALAGSAAAAYADSELLVFALAAVVGLLVDSRQTGAAGAASLAGADARGADRVERRDFDGRESRNAHRSVRRRSACLVRKRGARLRRRRRCAAGGSRTPIAGARRRAYRARRGRRGRERAPNGRGRVPRHCANAECATGDRAHNRAGLRARLLERADRHRRFSSPSRERLLRRLPDGRDRRGRAGRSLWGDGTRWSAARGSLRFGARLLGSADRAHRSQAVFRSGAVPARDRGRRKQRRGRGGLHAAPADCPRRAPHPCARHCLGASQWAPSRSARSSRQQ